LQMNRCAVAGEAEVSGARMRFASIFMTARRNGPGSPIIRALCSSARYSLESERIKRIINAVRGAIRTYRSASEATPSRRSALRRRLPNSLLQVKKFEIEIRDAAIVATTVMSSVSPR
jgi:hypothetical protein